MARVRIKPEEVNPADAEKILDFLNSAGTASELAEAIELPGERDVGLRLAQRLLDRREAIGTFTALQQVADVDQIGPDRFSQIVSSLRLGPRLTGGGLAVLVDGSAAFDFVKSVDGGTIRGQVATATLGPDMVARKSISSITYDDFTVEVGLGAGGGLLEWISASFDQGAVRRTGEVHALDFERRSEHVREFISALITEVTVPDLDGASKEPAYLTVKMTPDTIRYRKGNGQPVEGGPAKKWLASNYRCQFGDLPCGRVAKVDSFTWKQSIIQGEVGAFRAPATHPAQITVPDLKLTISLSDVQGWMDWHRDFLINGNCGPQNLVSGSIEILAPDLMETLARIDLEGVGIISLDPVAAEANQEAIARFTVELFCEQMRFVQMA